MKQVTILCLLLVLSAAAVAQNKGGNESYTGLSPEQKAININAVLEQQKQAEQQAHADKIARAQREAAAEGRRPLPPVWEYVSFSALLPAPTKLNPKPEWTMELNDQNTANLKEMAETNPVVMKSLDLLREEKNASYQQLLNLLGAGGYELTSVVPFQSADGAQRMTFFMKYKRQ